MRSEVLIRDATLSARAVWKVLCMFGQWLISVGKFVAGVSDGLSNETAEVMVHWLLQIVVIGGVAGGTGVLLFMMVKKVIKVYRENCFDLVSAVVQLQAWLLWYILEIGLRWLGMSILLSFSYWFRLCMLESECM